MALAFTMVISANAFAANSSSSEEETKVVITYDDAVERAIKNTTSIASIDDAV